MNDDEKLGILYAAEAILFILLIVIGVVIPCSLHQKGYYLRWIPALFNPSIILVMRYLAGKISSLRMSSGQSDWHSRGNCRCWHDDEHIND